ncbi:MAG TPA: GMC family oxidoreductase [Geminicoccaceae bacterium]|nr:GMC family oxidoreductase [Geminicoccaceae bacterium]
MLIDAHSLADGAVVEGDVCIVGSGAAGLTLARELAGAARRILVLEAGGLEADGDSQAFYAGENVGLPYFPLESCRLRQFGGTTGHWAGFCSPTRPFHLRRHDWVEDSGWPIDGAELEPYYARARAALGLPEPGFDPELWSSRLDEPLWPLDPARIANEQFFIHPLRLGEARRDEIGQSPTVTAYFNAPVVEIVPDARARHVEELRGRTTAGTGFVARARHFVLAAGGIENARLLLLSNAVQPAGLGNGHDLVGRYFADHPIWEQAAEIRLIDPGLSLGFYRGLPHDGLSVRGLLRVADAAQEAERIWPANFVLYPIWDPALSEPGMTALRQLRSRVSSGRWPDDLGSQLAAVAGDLDGILGLTWRSIRHWGVPVQKLDVLMRLTPVPHRDSRVTLGESRDALGVRVARVDWRLGEAEERAARRGLELLGAEVSRAGIGRLQALVDPAEPSWIERMVGANHHLGTTRMADEPSRGVVDRHCRVHGIDNLHCAGSSVFPTTGDGTPTMLIVALAIRLAEHLKIELG